MCTPGSALSLSMLCINGMTGMVLRRALISWIVNLAELIDENQAAVCAGVARNCHLVQVDGESRQPNAYLWCSNICSDMQIRISINVLASYRNKQPWLAHTVACMFYTRMRFGGRKSTWSRHCAVYRNQSG